MLDKVSITYSLRNLNQRKGRSLLTIFSILIGITATFVFISFGLGLFSYINSFTTSTSADKITIMPKGLGAAGLDSTFTITKSDVRAIEKTSGVYEATGAYTRAVQVTQDNKLKYVFVLGYDPSNNLITDLYSAEAVQGRLLKKGDTDKVVLGYNYLLPDKIFPKGYSLGEKIEVQGQKLEIVGFMKQLGNPQDDSNIYITNDYYEKLFPNTTGYAMSVARVDTSNITEVVNRVEKSLRKSRGLKEGNEDFFVQSFQDQLAQFTSALNIVIGFVILIALISVVVSAVNTANTMITSVLERYKEIGVIKSVGAKNSVIFNIFVFESGFLGFVAGCLGVLFGWIISFTAGQILNSLGWGFLTPSTPFSLFVELILFATLTGSLSGAWPAWQASKIKPVEALRYE